VDKDWGGFLVGLFNKTRWVFGYMAGCLNRGYQAVLTYEDNSHVKADGCRNDDQNGG